MAENKDIQELIEAIRQNTAPSANVRPATAADMAQTIDTRFEVFQSTLSSIDQSMKAQTQFTKSLLDVMNDNLAFIKEQAGDKAREEKLKVKEDEKSEKKPKEDKEKSAAFEAGENFVGLLGAPFTSLLGTIAAFGLAAAGLRGWEVRAIGMIRGAISSLSDSVIRGATNLRNSILVRFFGFTPDGALGRNALGRPTRLPSVSEQVATRMSDLRARALRMFGLGVDGRPITLRGANGRFTGVSVVGRISAAILRLFAPLRAAASGITDFISGAGSAIFNSERFKTASGFAKTVGKILKPIGFLFSAFDGVTAFMNSDSEGIIARLGDGIGAFLGDFIGAPFDLLKSAVSWIMRQVFGVEVDENGNALPGQGLAGWVVTKLNSFSFEEVIGSLVSGLFGIVQGAVDWVRLLFTDPGAAMSELWNGIVGEGGLVDILMTPINGAIGWVLEKFGWRDEDAPPFSLSEFISNAISSASTYIQEKFNDVRSFIQSIPERILFAAEEFWTNLKADFQIGLLELADWFKRLPIRLLASIANILGGVRIELPDNAVTRTLGIAGAGFSLLSQEGIDDINARANAANPDTSERIDAINAERDRELAGIDTRRSAAEEERLANLARVQEEAARRSAGASSAASIVTNSGNSSTDARSYPTNNYYVSTSPGTSVDPAHVGPS